MKIKPYSLRLAVSALFLLVILASCKKQYSFESTPDAKVVFPTTAQDVAKVNLIKEFSAALKNVYKNLWALHEVNATIKSGYYIDERVLLRDLLTPENSPLYKTEAFRKFNSRSGSFKQAFAKELSKGIYPLLQSAIGTPDGRINGREMEDWPTVDQTNEIWSNESGLCIYFPYSEDFTFSNPYDVNINTVNGQLVTIVTADREADEGPGEWPYYCSSDPNEPVNLENMTVCFSQVMINDGYAEVDPVHIVGVGAEPATPNGTTGTQTVYVVFIGEVRCSKQYDNLISFNGYLQGGGSELRFCRGSGYLVQDGNGQINAPQNFVRVNPTRKQIRKDKWITVNSEWDSDWKEDNLIQVFAIYEEDKQGTATINTSLQTTVTLTPASPTTPAVTAVRSVSFSWTFKTQDDILRQLNWSRESFFMYNQGGLNNGCGTRNGFTIYDCYSDISYTMPTQ
jgi:hypothetical protein